jgi:glycosyltransferase involved in cell wall biosynthesis
LERVAPIVRFVQDHTLFCPSLNKIWADGSNCDRPLGSICLERYFLTDGCSCFHRSGRVKPWIEGVGEFKKKVFEFEAAKRTRRSIVASRYMQGELVAAGDAKSHVAVIPYFTRANSAAIAPASLSKETERFLAASDAPLVFTPARLALPDKGLDVLLAALARAKAPLRAVIAGDGPARAWLEAKAEAEALGTRVHFTGWQSAGQIETLYARSRAVVFPSTWKEPFGLVGLEAMAHAKPVVAFDVGGVGEWLEHERTGHLLARGDVAAMAASIDALCQDAALASRLGAAGRERAAREFTETAHVDRVEAELAAAV